MLNQAIIKAALLGLKSNQVDKTIFHPKVQQYLGKESSNELMFLNGLSLSLQYAEAGKELPIIEKLSSQVETCTDENLSVVDAPLIRALDAITKDDFLHHNYYSFLKILSEKVLNQNQILPADKLIKVLMALNDVAPYEKRRVGFKGFYKTSVKNKLYHSFDDLKSMIVNSFGNSGSWIQKMMEPKTKRNLDELSAKERLAAFRKYWFLEKQNVIPFLEAFYAHETPNNQKKILQIIGQSLSPEDTDVYNFFEQFFDKKEGKRTDLLRRYFEMAIMMANSQHTDIQLFESIFSAIWAPRTILNKRLKLLPKKQLALILAPLDVFEIAAFVDEDSMQGLDLKLFFLFQLIPIERACQLLNMKWDPYLKAIADVKSLEKDKSFRSLRALLRNILKNNHKDFAKAILALSSKTKGAYLELLLLFSDEEIYEFLEKDFSIIDFSDLDIFEILVKELNCQKTWSEKLTQLILNRLLTHQHYYSYANRRDQALWLGGPFYHENVTKIVSNLVHLEEHKDAWKKDEIQSAIGQISYVKSALDNALNL